MTLLFIVCNYYFPYAENLFFPLFFGLFYVYVYPRISKNIYEYTLERTKELKTIKQSIEDETPLTQAEAREIRKLASTLEEEKDKALKNLSKKDEEWQVKLDNALGLMNEKVVGLNSDVVAANVMISDFEVAHDAFQKEQENIKGQLSQSNELLASKNDECEQLKKEIELLKKKLPKFTLKLPLEDVNVDIPPIQDNLIQSTQAYEQVMRYLHDEFDPMHEVNLVDKIVKATNLGKTLVRHIINTLIDDKVLINNAGTVMMTKEGAERVLNYIEKNNIPF
jgi:chromosome segregation ATPase